MYYTLFKELRKLVAGAAGIGIDPGTGNVTPSGPDGLQDIQWFNNQYTADTILAVPVVFIEFAALDIRQSTKQDLSRSDIMVRLHVVTEVHSESDGQVPDSDILEHEKLALMVRDAVEFQKLPFNGSFTGPLYPQSWEFDHHYNGFMVTRITLKCKG